MSSLAKQKGMEMQEEPVEVQKEALSIEIYTRKDPFHTKKKILEKAHINLNHCHWGISPPPPYISSTPPQI